MLDFDAVQNALQGLGATADAAEAHGILCALLLDDSALLLWLGHLIDDLPDEGDVLAAERIETLRELYADTRDQLANDELGFALLLPDEDAEFGARLAGLSAWCQGFVYGIGVAGLAEARGLDAEAREYLSDLVEIGKLSADEEGGDEAELQFAEVAEHVRMAALLLNESLRPAKPPPTVH